MFVEKRDDEGRLTHYQLEGDCGTHTVTYDGKCYSFSGNDNVKIECQFLAHSSMYEITLNINGRWVELDGGSHPVDPDTVMQKVAEILNAQLSSCQDVDSSCQDGASVPLDIGFFFIVFSLVLYMCTSN